MNHIWEIFHSKPQIWSLKVLLLVLFILLICMSKGSLCPPSFRQQSHSEKLTSSYRASDSFSLSCYPVEPNRRVHTIHNQSQPGTPPPSVIGPMFSDIQREFQKKERVVTNMTLLQVNPHGVHYTCGVPQGSNVDPLLLSVYMLHFNK